MIIIIIIVDIFIKKKNPQKLNGLFSKNPHIRSFGIDKLSQHFCNLINEYLVNLDNLTVTSIDVENEIRFEHVKYLEFRSIHVQMDKLTLPRIETVVIPYTDKIPVAWTDFVKKHQSMSHLIIQDVSGFAIHRVLIELLIGLPNLTEITLERSKNHINDKTIGEIIQK